jgi:hypothetical protein
MTVSGRQERTPISVPPSHVYKHIYSDQAYPNKNPIFGQGNSYFRGLKNPKARQTYRGVSRGLSRLNLNARSKNPDMPRGATELPARRPTAACCYSFSFFLKVRKSQRERLPYALELYLLALAQFSVAADTRLVCGISSSRLSFR